MKENQTVQLILGEALFGGNLIGLIRSKTNVISLECRTCTVTLLICVADMNIMHDSDDC